MKVGDYVTVKYYPYMKSDCMKSNEGKSGMITHVDATSLSTKYFVKGYWWPESALTLVEDGKVDDKFQWTDELVSDFARKVSMNHATIRSVDDFKKYIKEGEKLKPTVHKCIIQGDKTLGFIIYPYGNNIQILH